MLPLYIYMRAALSGHLSRENLILTIVPTRRNELPPNDEVAGGQQKVQSRGGCGIKRSSHWQADYAILKEFDEI
jgi:hypothetical protein